MSVSSVLVRLGLHFHVDTQARVLKILDRLKSLGLVTFQLEEDNKPEKICATLKFLSVVCDGRVVCFVFMLRTSRLPIT